MTILLSFIYFSIFDIRLDHFLTGKNKSTSGFELLTLSLLESLKQHSECHQTIYFETPQFGPSFWFSVTAGIFYMGLSISEMMSSFLSANDVLDHFHLSQPGVRKKQKSSLVAMRRGSSANSNDFVIDNQRSNRYYFHFSLSGCRVVSVKT